MHLKKIVVDFGLIVLDELLSVLDLNVEEKIMTQILDKNNENIVFIISHRLINIVSTGKIFARENGKIIEFGAHDELIVSKGEYYSIKLLPWL